MFRHQQQQQYQQHNQQQQQQQFYTTRDLNKSPNLSKQQPNTSSQQNLSNPFNFDALKDKYAKRESENQIDYSQYIYRQNNNKTPENEPFSNTNTTQILQYDKFQNLQNQHPSHNNPHLQLESNNLNSQELQNVLKQQEEQSASNLSGYHYCSRQTNATSNNKTYEDYSQSHTNTKDESNYNKSQDTKQINIQNFNTSLQNKSQHPFQTELNETQQQQQQHQQQQEYQKQFLATGKIIEQIDEKQKQQQNPMILQTNCKKTEYNQISDQKQGSKTNLESQINTHFNPPQSSEKKFGKFQFNQSNFRGQNTNNFMNDQSTVCFYSNDPNATVNKNNASNILPQQQNFLENVNINQTLDRLLEDDDDDYPQEKLLLQNQTPEILKNKQFKKAKPQSQEKERNYWGRTSNNSSICDEHFQKNNEKISKQILTSCSNIQNISNAKSLLYQEQLYQTQPEEYSSADFVVFSKEDFTSFVQKNDSYENLLMIQLKKLKNLEKQLKIQQELVCPNCKLKPTLAPTSMNQSNQNKENTLKNKQESPIKKQAKSFQKKQPHKRQPSTCVDPSVQQSMIMDEAPIIEEAKTIFNINNDISSKRINTFKNSKSANRINYNSVYSLQTENDSSINKTPQNELKYGREQNTSYNTVREAMTDMTQETQVKLNSRTARTNLVLDTNTNTNNNNKASENISMNSLNDNLTPQQISSIQTNTHINSKQQQHNFSHLNLDTNASHITNSNFSNILHTPNSQLSSRGRTNTVHTYQANISNYLSNAQNTGIKPNNNNNNNNINDKFRKKERSNTNNGTHNNLDSQQQKEISYQQRYQLQQQSSQQQQNKSDNKNTRKHIRGNNQSNVIPMQNKQDCQIF